MTFLCALLFFAADWDTLLKDARTKYAKGDYEAARVSVEEALGLTGGMPPYDPKRYELSRLSAEIHTSLGNFTEAESAFLQSINHREHGYGMKHALVADDLTAFAMMLRAKPEPDRALLVLDRSRQIHLLEGISSPALADDYSRMALIQMDLQNTGLAASLLEQTLQIREATLGTGHPGLLAEIDRLAIAYINGREYTKAEDSYRRALVIRERHFGKDSPETLQNVEGLAYALFGSKKFDEAENYYKRLLALWQASAGKEHPMVATTLDKLSLLYREQDKWIEGQQAADSAMAYRTHFHAAGLVREAGFLMSKSKAHEARVLYKQALALLDSKRTEHTELIKQINEKLTGAAPSTRKSK